VDGVEAVQGQADVVLGRRDEFEQGLGLVGGDLRMGQGRAELDRMRRARELALAVDAQGFAFDAAQALAEQAAVRVVVQQGQAAGQLVRHSVSFLILPNQLVQRVTEKRTARRRALHF